MLSDPIEVLFCTQLGPSTDINRALTYFPGLVRGLRKRLSCCSAIRTRLQLCGDSQAHSQSGRSGVQLIAALALDGRGAPFDDYDDAAKLAAMGIPYLTASDLFPDLMAATIRRHSLSQLTAKAGIVRV